MVLSGFGAGAMAREAVAGGADGYVEKGGSLKGLLQRVRDLADARDAGRRHARPAPDAASAAASPDHE